MRPKLHREAKSKVIPKVIQRNTPRKVKQKKTKNLSNAITSHPTGDIPNEILSQILCRCDEATLRTAMRTCRRWHSVINETIGVSVAVGKPYKTIQKNPLSPFQPIEVIEYLGVKNCFVGDLTDVQGCPFRYSQTVRSITFDGPITKFNLVTLLSPLPALTHLTMHYVSLENTKITRSILRTTSLKSLRITSNGFNDEYDRNKTVSILQNLISLLMSIYSQQLAVLILDMINIPFYDRKVSKAIFTVLLRHKCTMRNIQFYNFAERLDPGPPGTETEEEADFINDEIVSKAIQQAVYLKRISYGGKRGMESDEAWNQLIQSQKSLQEMFYMNDNRDIYTTWIPCLMKNAATLRKTLFHISGVDDARNTVRFDCKLLTNFQQLSHLLIRGRKVVFPFPNPVNQGENVIARITMKAPVLKNIHFVPATVTVFSMRDICVETESLVKFTQPCFLPNIKKFRLVECGSLGEYGINPETLVELLKREAIGEIEIIRSFSLINWDNATGKDIYEDALFYRIKSEWEFHAQRDSSGHYCTKDDPMFNYGRFETALRADDVCEVVFQ